MPPALLFAIGPPLSAWAGGESTGFSAVQRTRFVSSDIEVSSKFTYGHHRLRIDPRNGPTIVLNMQDGQMWLIENTKKRFATATLEELAALRKRLRASFAQQLENAPPDIRRQLERQMEQVQQMSQSRLRPQFHGQDKVGKFACTNVSWRQGLRTGSACLGSETLPIRTQEFEADCAQLVKLLQESGAGTAATSLVFLQLGAHGLPLRFSQTLPLGASEQKQVSRLEAVVASKQGLAFFRPPKSYQQVPFETLMGPPSNEF